jgi:hypothetical protein
MENPEAHGQVISDTPGRLRIRMQRPHRHTEVIHQTKSNLEGMSGVRLVEMNPASGSVMVSYNPTEISTDDILSMLRDAGVIVMQLATGMAMELPKAGRSSAATDLITAIDDLDRRVSLFSGRKFDLKLLFPAALFGLGIRQVFAQGLGLSQVPGYILLWYAFDSFWKFHHEEASEKKPADRLQEEPANVESPGQPRSESRARSPRQRNG